MDYSTPLWAEKEAAEGLRNCWQHLSHWGQKPGAMSHEPFPNISTPFASCSKQLMGLRCPGHRKTCESRIKNFLGSSNNSCAYKLPPERAAAAATKQTNKSGKPNQNGAAGKAREKQQTVKTGKNF